MKTFLTIALCVSLSSIALGAGESDTIGGIWVGNNYESLFIFDTVAFFETNADRHMFRYSLKGDSLELFSPYSTQEDSSDNMSEEPDDDGGFCFIIKHRSPDSLVLRPYCSSTRKQYKHIGDYEYLFDSTSAITLQSIFSFKDTLLSFDRLLFCTRYNFQVEAGLRIRVGSKGEIHFPHDKLIEEDLRVIIDSTKTMYLYGNKFAMQFLGLDKYEDKNALKQGYYQGCLSDSLYGLLIDVLSISSLDRMQLKRDLRDSSAPEYTLDIYYNDKFKRTIGTDFPISGYGLFMYLSSIETKVPLVKSKTAKKMFEQFYKTRDK